MSDLKQEIIFFQKHVFYHFILKCEIDLTICFIFLDTISLKYACSAGRLNSMICSVLLVNICYMRKQFTTLDKWKLIF